MLATLIIVFSVLGAVGVHYEALRLASALTRRLPGRRRYEVALSILLVLVAHLVEVLVFTIGWQLLVTAAGATTSPPGLDFGQLFYLSGACYTSLGFGDLVPTNRPGEVLSVVEAVTGLVMIAWTASYTFWQMSSHWGD